MDEKSNVIEANLEAIESRIAAACSRANRKRSDLRLIAVSKTFPGEAINAAAAAGMTDIGENRVQELRDKLPEVTARPRYHLIGHLQSNKAKEAARIFDVIHTVDSIDIAKRLSRFAGEFEKTLDVLIEINVGGEEQKAGVAPAEAESLARAVNDLPSLRLVGLMAIPPVAEAEPTRGYFRTLRELRDAIGRSLGSEAFRELSMGMTDDFEIAIEEGSTMIRLGRAIFGARG